MNNENLLQLFDETYERIQREKRLPVFPAVFRTAYNTVFSGSAAKIGQLPSCLVTELVNYYYSVQTLVELTEIFSTNLQDISDRKADRDPGEINEQLETLSDIRVLGKQVREIGIELVNQIEMTDS